MIALPSMRCLDEAEKLQLVVGKEAGNLRQVRAVLLHVEEKIAEFAQRIEISDIPKRSLATLMRHRRGRGEPPVLERHSAVFSVLI